MSDNTGDRAYARDARLQPAVAWIALLVFFIGCGCFTVAVVELASNKSISASQQTDAADPRYGSNLFEAQDAEQDRGARGSFDAQAHDRDPVSFVARNRAATLGATTATLGALGVGAAALMRRR